MLTTDHGGRIRKFMTKAGQDVPEQPCVPDEKTRKLRAMLILEEALETIEALGFTPHVHTITDEGHSISLPVQHGCINEDVTLEVSGEPDLVEIVDGCCDVSVVTIGTLLACGVGDAPVLLEVDQSNLRKFGPGGYRDEHGKWIKPADWTPPDIARHLGDV